MIATGRFTRCEEPGVEEVLELARPCREKKPYERVYRRFSEQGDEGTEAVG